MKISKTLVEALSMAAEESMTTGHGITFYKDMGRKKLTYFEFMEKALEIAGGLQKVGAKKGSYILLQIKEQESFLLLFWGSILGGAIPVPLAVNDEREFHIERVKKVTAVLKDYILVTEDKLKEDFIQGLDSSSSIFTVNEIQEKAFRISPYEVEEEDIAFIQFSSGSTSEPKGVCLTHKNNCSQLNMLFKEGGGREILKHGKTMGWVPLAHNLGLVGFHIMPVFLGAEQYLLTPEFLIENTVYVLKQIKEEQINGITCPNFLMKWMLAKLSIEDLEQMDFSSLISISMGAEPINSGTVRRFIDKMKPYGLKREAIRCAYGMTESVMAVTIQKTTNGVETVRINNKEYILNGTPIEGMEIYTIDDNGERQENGTPGELVIESESVMKQYLGQEGSEIVREQRFKTGDIGIVLEEGLVLLGRKKDMIILNAKNYYAQDIEAILEEKTNISQDYFVITSVLDEENTDQVQLYILEEQYKKNPEYCTLLETAFEEYTNSSLSEIFGVANIPRTVSGKKQRFKMKQMQEKISIKKAIQFTNEMPETEIQKQIALVWEEILGVSVQDIHTSFFRLGGDSLMALECIAELGKRNIFIEQDVFVKNPTIAKLATLVTTEKEILSEQNVPSCEVRPLPFHYSLLNYNQSKQIVNQWNLSIMMDFSDIPNRSILEKIMTCLVNQHDGLRHRYSIDGGVLREWIVDVSECICVEEKIYTDKKELEYLAARYQESLDITNCPLKIIAFRKEGESKGKILFICHHSIGCAYSFGLMIKDFILIYRTLVIQKKEYVLQKKLTSVRQWSELVNDFAFQSACEEDIPYWRNIVDTEDYTPYDFQWKMEDNIMEHERIYDFYICQREDFESIEGIQHKLLGAWAKTVKEWTKQNDVRFLFSSTGRYGIPSSIPYDLSRTVGWVGSTIPVLIQIDEEDSPLQLVENIKESMGSIPHEGVSYRCLKEINRDAVISQKPLPMITYNYVEVNLSPVLYEEDAYKISISDENIGLLEHPKKIRGRMLDFAIHRRENKYFYARMHYSTQIHKEETIRYLAEQFQQNMKLFYKKQQ